MAVMSLRPSEPPAAGRVLPSDPAQTRRKEQAGVGYWMPAARGKPAISACGIARRRKSYCRLDRSDLFKPVYCCDKKRCRLVIAEEFEIASRRHSKSRFRTKAKSLGVAAAG
jgi:hypothetical protein